MAEYNVNTSLNITERPSIFEVLAQESLSQGLRHALRYLASFLADNYPNSCGVLARYMDELIFVGDIVIQYYHLQYYQASFAEHFYGLKRIGSRSGKIMDKSQLIRSVIGVVILPYIRQKLETLYLEFQQRDRVNMEQA